jgi:tRNA A37 threonylcarbamoyltransferase TsaD
VALAFLSIPSIMFSIPKGGDHIDAAAGAVTGEHATRMRAIKEDGLDLSKAPGDKYAEALHIYYDDLIQHLVRSIKQAVSKAEQLPRADRALPIVLAGGTAKPKGFRDRFDKMLRSQSFPFEVSEVRLAADPLTATARGALIAAMYEK